MASITSAQSGLSTATSTWVGGVVPVVGDKVTIAAGHTVTLAGTHHWGDDTSTAITVNGTLKASRTVSSQLTCRGDLVVVPRLGGYLDIGTEADPIPASVTHTIIPNDSAAMGHDKWRLRTDETAGTWTGGVSIWGAHKTPYTYLRMPIASGDLVIPVFDATGWQIGDLIGFAPINTTAPIYRQVTNIAPAGGAAADVTIGSGIGRSGDAGNGVVNLTRNVRISGANPQTWRSSAVSLRVPNSTVTDRIEIGPCTITATGNNGTGGNWLQAGLNVYYESSTTRSAALRKVAGPVITSLVSVAGAVETHTPATRQCVCFFNNQAARMQVESVICALPNDSGSLLLTYAGASVDFGAESVILGGQNALLTQFSQGAVDCAYRGRIWGVTNVFSGAGAITYTLSGARIGAHARANTPNSAGSINLTDCVFGDSGGYHTLPKNQFAVSAGTLAPTKISNASGLTGTWGLARQSNIDGAHPAHSLVLQQINGDAAANERYTRGGRVHRDGTRARRSTGSICLASWYSQNVLSMPLASKVQAGATLRIKGAVWIEASYLPGDAPAISLSGTGLSTVNWSAPTVADQWHEFDLQITNTNAYPTDVAIALSARSSANTETARVWVDGLFSDPWSGSVRHHGFQWLAQTALVADTRITLTEAAALALPVAVNHVAQTITVTGAVTARQVFEACIADLVQTANQTRAVHISSATGDTFETTYTVVLSGAGAINGAYQDAAGRHVTISAPALIAGSRVQVYDVTTHTEIYNAVLPSVGLTLPAIWTADHTLRIRADHPDMLGMETAAVLTSAGAVVLDAQQADTVYTSNAIDGSTCTEFVADGANVQIDINDPDGVTSVKRLYAWAQWYQTTAEGIASPFFMAITAADTANYRIDRARSPMQLDNVGADAVKLVDGYLYTSDGSRWTAPGSQTIEPEFGRAYVAGVDGLARESTVQAVLALTL